MKEILRKAYDSTYVDDSFVKNCAALCDTLVDEVAYQIAEYNEKNKEVDTMTLKRRTAVKLDEARAHFRFLQRVIDL